MDIRTEINGHILYLEDMDGLTLTGSISDPTRVTLLTQGGDTILSTIHYADFSGLITLDLAKIIKDQVFPRHPDDEWWSSDEQTLKLTFRIATSTYAQTYDFELNTFSRDALSMMTDIDALDVPMDGMFPLPVTVHTTSAIETAFRETARAQIEVFSEVCEYMGRGQSMKTTYLDTLHDTEPFRLLVKGESGRELRSPVYTPRPGKFEIFTFRNRFGAMEIFPMSGDLLLEPEYKFEIMKMGKLTGSTLNSESVTLTQFSGPLTRKASRVLSEMLAEGYAFHLVNGDWKRIIITEAKISLRRSDTLHKQSFSFRYQEPVDIRDIII